MITSTSNAQVKSLLQLQKKAKARRQEDCFIVEGIRMFREAPADWVRQIYVSESFAKAKANQPYLEGKRYEILSDTVFSYVSDTKTPQGVLCVMKMAHYKLADMLKPDGAYLLLENVQDPGNLGTMFRTAEGAGISGIIMSSDTVDIYNPKTIRSTMGSIYRMPFCIVDDLSGALEQMKKNGIRSYAAHLAKSVAYDEADYTKGTAFLIGNEGNGLTDALTAAADQRIHIPMGGDLESLNAAMAAGILMYEANRQRRRSDV